MRRSKFATKTVARTPRESERDPGLIANGVQGLDKHDSALNAGGNANGTTRQIS
jgi:hypothetical protein